MHVFLFSFFLNFYIRGFAAQVESKLHAPSMQQGYYGAALHRIQIM